MEPSIIYPPSAINHRIEYQGVYGIVKYIGPLKHLPPEKTDAQLWLGVEWDDVLRGKHNGTIENMCYFTTENNANSGSLLKLDKADFGVDILDGLLIKYFKEDPKTMKQQLLDSIKKDKNVAEHAKLEKNEEEKQEKNEKTEEKQTNNGETQDKNSEKIDKNDEKIEKTDKNDQEEKDKPEEFKENEKPKERAPALIEYDEDAYFETAKKHKKKVEFIGFDRIWKKINNLKEIQELSLQDLKISTFSQPTSLSLLLPNLKNLALEKNLIFDYQQIIHIGLELPLLESLSISQNRLKEPEDFLENLKEIEVFYDNSNEKIQVDPMKAFPNLKTLILIEMNLHWGVVNKILGLFGKLEELILCRNKLINFNELTLDMEKTLPNLLFLNLEENLISDFSGLMKFGQLQKLEKLTMSKNYLQKIGEIKGFAALHTLSIESNLFEDLSVLCELSQFEKLNSLRLKNNPLVSTYGAPYIRQRAVAENQNLMTINGSDLKKYERKDCEIFYLRKTFEEFFKATNSKYYQYDFDDFLNNFCKKDHPSIPRLMKIYGNPFEMDPNAKKDENAPVVQKNVMLMLKITALTGPYLGKEPMKKKFPDSTTIVNLKGFLTKFLGVGSEKMVVFYKAPNQGHEPMEVLEEDLKSLMFYSVCNGGELFVDEKD